MKKHIIFLVVILILLTPFGCSDYLDVDAEAVKPSDEFFQTEEDAVSAVNAIYARMRTWPMVAFAYVIMQEITSDNSISLLSHRHKVRLRIIGTVVMKV
jgi:hypothetical protein